MAMNDEGTAQQSAQPKVKKKVSPVRNVIAFVLLVAFSAIAYLEWNANRQSNAAKTKLNNALAKEEGDLLSQKQVEDLIGRQADGPGVEGGDELKVTYTWKGIFRQYPMIAVYKKQNPPKLVRME
jgi:hypothetical protein